MYIHEIIVEKATQELAVNSFGRPIAHTPEGIRNFWNWFGRSKTVDKLGRPLVAFHGTKADFRSFDPARSNKQGGVPIDYRSTYFFSVDPDSAQTYAGQETHQHGLPTEELQAEFKRLASQSISDAVAFLHKHSIPNMKTFDPGGNLMPVYLRMLRPLKINGRGNNWAEVPFQDDFWSTRDLAEYAMDNGYDGLIIRRIYDRREGSGKPADVYVVFNPSQIKSAIGNRGGFSSDSPMIDEERP